ncbi:MAG: hypothetical protein ACKV19_00155 [Verrucomicrobiales bacterium]
MVAGFEQLPNDTPHLLAPAAAFDRLWKHIESVPDKGGIAALLRNGLDENHNSALLSADSSLELFMPEILTQTALSA